MTSDWQSLAAITVVTLTMIIFLKRTLIKKRKGAGGGCNSCDAAGPKSPVKR